MMVIKIKHIQIWRLSRTGAYTYKWADRIEYLDHSFRVGLGMSIECSAVDNQIGELHLVGQGGLGKMKIRGAVWQGETRVIFILNTSESGIKFQIPSPQ
jgi:hypothetical protein